MTIQNKQYLNLVEELNNVEKYKDFKECLCRQHHIVYERLNKGIDDAFLTKISNVCNKCGLIRRSISEKSQDYIIMLCDDEDVSNIDKKRLIMAKNNAQKVFVIMVCPNKIMREDHDVSGLPEIIERKKELSGFPVGLTIEKNCITNISNYFELIVEYVYMDRFVLFLKNDVVCVEELIKSFEKELDDEPWDLINTTYYVQSLKKRMDIAKGLIVKTEAVLQDLIAQYSEYASDCKNELAEEKFHKEDVGDFAADLLFKYNGVQNILREELEQLKKSSCMEDAVFSFAINNCLSKLEEKPQISFVGNFSSGKTSYINWLLAMEGNKQLRTSGGHNTAILTFVKKSEANERVLLEYKDQTDLFEWKLFVVEYQDDVADVYRGENNAVVVRVDELERVIIFKYKGERKRIVLHNKYDEILVKKNDKLQKGMQLTGGAKSYFDMPRNSANVSLRSVEEYQVIINQIQKRKLNDCVISISYISKKNLKNRIAAEVKQIEISNTNDIIDFLRRIISLEKKYASPNIALEEVAQCGFWDSTNVRYIPKDIDYIYSVSIKAKCYFENKEEILTDKCWKKYCGTGENDEKVYTETPEGYLFTKQMTYYLDKGFLNYADIIDTPGLGSTSDEHDDITERYIRTNVSNLLVMLKIDKNGQSMSRRKFIYEIAKIYEDSGRNKDNVFFVCNLWSKDYEKRVLIELERICDLFFKAIQECGFNCKNFYVIDIQKMQAGHHANMMFDKYQSDEIFKTRFIAHIADEGIQQQIKVIREEVEQMFLERQEYYESLKMSHELEQHNRQEKMILLEDLKKKVLKMKFNESFETLFDNNNEALDSICQLGYEIENISKRKDWISFTEKCLYKKSYIDDEEYGDKYDDIGVIELICKDTYEENQIKDRIVDLYILKLTRLKKILNDDLSYDKQNPIYKSIIERIENAQRIGMSGFPFNDLRNRIKLQSQHFKSKIHFIYNADVSKQDAKEISEFINAQIEKCRIENKANYDLLVKEYSIVLETIISDIDRMIKLMVQQDDEEMVKTYSNYTNNLNLAKNRWTNKISEFSKR